MSSTSLSASAMHFGQMQTGKIEFDTKQYTAELVAANYSALDTYHVEDWTNG